MEGIVQVTPAIWVRDGDRSPIRLGDADDLADWLGRTCTSLMQTLAIDDRRILELEGLLARVEAAIDAGESRLPPDLHGDTIATVSGLNGVSAWSMANRNRPAAAYPHLDFVERAAGPRIGRM
ncbi:hypothetical protein ACFW16_26760 [Inquilinus sp. NPDC058860]|uniref:hypothetical protein n=1 Tax=Inquilinus sp. NPDC058860 TaxID=3346652 RepID=UPI0036BE4DAC